MLEEISNFYKEVVAPSEIDMTPQGMMTTIPPLTRFYFLVGAGLAIFVFIQKVALAIFFLVASIFTCFQSQYTKASLFQNAQEIPTYLGAIIVGYIGAVIPQTMNERVLHIPANGLIIRSL